MHSLPPHRPLLHPPKIRSCISFAILATFIAPVCIALSSRPLQAAETVSAGDRERAEAKAIEAKAFFRAGLFQNAAEGFMQAYAISKKPEMMFNAARAYEQGGLSPQAIALFDQYVGLAGVSDAGRKDAQERIARMRDKAAPAPQVAAPTPQPPILPTEPPTPTVQTPPAQSAPPSQPVEPPAPAPVVAIPAPTLVQSAPVDSRLRWVSWTLLGGGAFCVFAAISGWSDAAKQINNASSSFDFGQTDAKNKYNALIENQKQLRNSDVFLGVAGVGLSAWGAYRLWGPVPKPEHSYSVSPQIGSHVAGLQMNGRF